MNDGRTGITRRIERAAIGGAILAGILVAGQAIAEPPQQGEWIHDTEELEFVNFSVKTARSTPGSGCAGDLTIDHGQLRFKDKSGFTCGGMDVLNTLFIQDPAEAGAVEEDVSATQQITGAHEGWETFTPEDAIGVHHKDPAYHKIGKQILLQITDVRLAARAPAETPSFATAKDTPPRLPQWEYKARWYWNGKSGDLCPGWATAALGTWSEKGDYTQSADRFSLACLPVNGLDGGVMAKCTNWGYPPWSGAGTTLVGTVLKGKGLLPSELADSDDEAERFHEACTRMARADYCGEGLENTIPNTPILFYDIMRWPVEDNKLKPVIHHGDDGDFYVEAAWAADKAKGAHFHGNAICLSKKRWATVEPNGECLSLPDPRTDKKHVVKPCEDYTVEELVKKGALFVNYSTFTDAALHHLTNTKTGQSIATTFIDVASGQSFDAKKAGSGYRLDPGAFRGLDVSDWVWDSDEGPILSPRAPKRAVTTLEASPLFRYLYPDGTFVTSTETPAPAGYKDKVLEGYVLPTKIGATAHSVVLRQSKDHNKKDILDTRVAAPGKAAAADKAMGFIVPVEDINVEIARRLHPHHK